MPNTGAGLNLEDSIQIFLHFLLSQNFPFDTRGERIYPDPMFRPCIDLHEGRVKQIVGSSLSDDSRALRTNFVSDRPSGWFAEMFKRDGLRGGHVIMLGPGNEAAAREALGAFPGGM